MEHQNESELVGESVQDKDENSNSEDRRRSSSISSVSDIESAITDFSLDDSTQLDRNDHGKFTTSLDDHDILGGNCFIGLMIDGLICPFR